MEEPLNRLIQPAESSEDYYTQTTKREIHESVCCGRIMKDTLSFTFDWEDIPNTQVRVRPDFQTPQFVKNTPLRVVFSTLFSVFENVAQHSLSQASEAFLIAKAKPLKPFGLNRCEEIGSIFLYTFFYVSVLVHVSIFSILSTSHATYTSISIL